MGPCEGGAGHVGESSSPTFSTLTPGVFWLKQSWTNMNSRTGQKGQKEKPEAGKQQEWPISWEVMKHIHFFSEDEQVVWGSKEILSSDYLCIYLLGGDRAVTSRVAHTDEWLEVKRMYYVAHWNTESGFRGSFKL